MSGHNFIQPNWGKLAEMGIYPENPTLKKAVENIQKGQEAIKKAQEKAEKKDNLIYCPICADNKIKLGFKSEGGLRLHLIGKHKLSSKTAAEVIKKAKSL